MEDITNGQNKKGRKSLPWNEKAAKTKEEEILKFSRELMTMPKEKVLSSVVKMLKETGDKDLTAVIKAATRNSDVAKSAKKKLKTEELIVTPLTKMEAVGLVFDCKLTKFQYKLLREKINSCGQKILPCYDHVTSAKIECRPPPESVSISERTASVKLQGLLTHTLERIVLLSNDFICETHIRAGKKHEMLRLKCSYGFDGSSGQSNYKQGYASSSNGSSSDDSSLCVTTMIPLGLENHNGIQYWRNNSPQITRFCRPLHLSYRLPFKSWQIKSEFKMVAAERKKSIQDKFWNKVALRVDYPSPGGSGTSHDVNTARRAFSNNKTLSAILEIDEKLIYDLRTILIAFGSQLPIDYKQFQIHCYQLIVHYVNFYSWFKLPANPVISSKSLNAQKCLRKREPLPADVIHMLVPTNAAVVVQVSDEQEVHLDPEFAELLNELSFIGSSEYD
ncbi:unnamed protein product [Allacma fusca]|uniref:Uncharacterized protein n=1 Tax=Allacma fusca TaxID=39272 RepID=A0A8J2KJ06_9HEXA|nr:unnamed protein product [Allacma fusca]